MKNKIKLNIKLILTIESNKPIIYRCISKPQKCLRHVTFYRLPHSRHIRSWVGLVSTWWSGQPPSDAGLSNQALVQRHLSARTSSFKFYKTSWNTSDIVWQMASLTEQEQLYRAQLRLARIVIQVVVRYAVVKETTITRPIEKSNVC